MKIGNSPAEKFQNLLTEHKGRMIWNAKQTFDGEKVVMECWSVPARDYQKDAKLVILMRWRDGNCVVFRQASMSHNIKTGLEDLENWLLFAENTVGQAVETTDPVPQG